MGSILETARKYDLRVIEDATESLGAICDGQKVGHLGDIACFSFNGNKVITTGGGGMIVTDREDWAERAIYLTTQAKDDPVEYFHNEVGYNYRLTNIQAAMGVAQMERLEEFIAKKRKIAGAYHGAFTDVQGLTTMAARPGAEPTYWLYTVLLHEATTLEQRKSVVRSLNDGGVGSRPLWHPVHDLPPYQQCQSYLIEHSTGIYRRGVTLPSSVGLQPQEQQACIERFISILPSPA
jgi:dTDP-4-amino-4,6-dideoxygalactose transaminase